MAELVKKSVAIGIAGVAAVVVAAWRQVQRDNTLDKDVAVQPSPTPVAGKPGHGPAGSSTEAKAEEAATKAAGATVDSDSSKAELYEVAQDLGIEGRSKMNKTELLAAIRSAS